MSILSEETKARGDSEFNRIQPTTDCTLEFNASTLQETSVGCSAEKLKSGIESSDASLMDKLKEVETRPSTQTGGHLGQSMSFALEKAGVIQKL